MVKLASRYSYTSSSRSITCFCIGLSYLPGTFSSQSFHTPASNSVTINLSHFLHCGHFHFINIDIVSCNEVSNKIPKLREGFHLLVFGIFFIFAFVVMKVSLKNHHWLI